MGTLRMPRDRRVRYAVVGLGHFAQAAILPAFKQLKNSELVALVSGSAHKLDVLARMYRVPRTATYDDYNRLLQSGAIDAVYIALPNHLHCDYAMRAARAQVHVLCEKPMAVTPNECELMIQECEVARVKLMIGYRLHFEEANLMAIEIARSGRIGEVRLFDSQNCMPVREGNVRTSADVGGGPLYDIGLYCINAARYIFQAEPCQVSAVAVQSRGDRRFERVESQLAALLRFPGDRLATFTTSFETCPVSRYQVVGTKGTLIVDPAFGYDVELRHELKIGNKVFRRTFEKRDQIAAELSYFSDCILSDRQPEPSGEEGLLDIRIIHALFQSERERRAIQLVPVHRSERPDLSQERFVPPHAQPDVRDVDAPSV